ncbi:MAG TPA: hypothetical protein G4N94_09810, partial [Caldilineae bacterium]|nr:hypothetical protein [Caldilineae bacterium]
MKHLTTKSWLLLILLILLIAPVAVASADGPGPGDRFVFGSSYTLYSGE